MDRLECNEGAPVTGADSVTIGTVAAIDPARQPPVLLVRLDDGTRTVGIDAGDVDLARSTADDIRLTIAGATLLRTAETGESRDEGRVTIPLISEVLVPHRREALKGRVRIHKRVETHPVERHIDLKHEVVDIVHVPVGEEIAEVPDVRQEGDTTIVPVVEEILVIEKRLRLVEEVRITRRTEVETETIRDELRREMIDVEEERVSDQT